MASRYAENTSVPADRTRIELEKTLRRYGADQFMYGWDDSTNRQVVAFRMAGRQIRIDLPLPDPDDSAFRLTPGGSERSSAAAGDAYEKEVRRRWRSLLLVVKAKLTAVADGISTLEREFLADVVLPDGRTLGAWVTPQLEAAYGSGQMPALLPGSGGEQ